MVGGGMEFEEAWKLLQKLEFEIEVFWVGTSWVWVMRLIELAS
jgi:hypothetical protein